MRMAEKFNVRSVCSLYAGRLSGHRRRRARASLQHRREYRDMARIRVPIIVFVIGEGGSGGALGIGIGDR